MSSQITPIITTNIHRKLLSEAAVSDSTKTTNPIIIGTSIGTGLVAPIKIKTPPTRPIKEWGKSWT